MMKIQAELSCMLFKYAFALHPCKIYITTIATFSLRKHFEREHRELCHLVAEFGIKIIQNTAEMINFTLCMTSKDPTPGEIPPIVNILKEKGISSR